MQVSAITPGEMFTGAGEVAAANHATTPENNAAQVSQRALSPAPVAVNAADVASNARSAMQNNPVARRLDMMG